MSHLTIHSQIGSEVESRHGLPGVEETGLARIGSQSESYRYSSKRETDDKRQGEE